MDDKPDLKSKDDCYFCSVTERLYDCSFNTRDPENEKSFATLAEKDILFSKSSSGQCDKLDEEVLEIIDEGEVLTSDTSPPEQECNSEDLINFDSEEVLQPPALRNRMSWNPQGISSFISSIRAENLPVNGKNQSVSREKAAPATSTVAEDHFDNHSLSGNSHDELDLMNENSCQRIQIDSNTPNAMVANSNDSTENSSNGDNGDSGNGNNDSPFLIRSALQTGAAALRIYNNISRFMK